MRKEKEIQTFSELYCLLNCFPEIYLKKLPKRLLRLIKERSNQKYYIEIDTEKSIEEQNISEETKNMLVVLKYNYWSNEEEKKVILEILRTNEIKYQEQLREKYNPDNLFNNKNEKQTEYNPTSVFENEKEVGNNSFSMIKYKESIFTKILKWFRKN